MNRRILRTCQSLPCYLIFFSVLFCKEKAVTEWHTEKDYFVATLVGLNARKGPDAASEKVKLLPCGTKLRILKISDAKSTVDGISEHWLQTSEGWVFGGYVGEEKSICPADLKKLAGKYRQVEDCEAHKAKYITLKTDSTFEAQATNCHDVYEVQGVFTVIKSHVKLKVLTDSGESQPETAEFKITSDYGLRPVDSESGLEGCGCGKSTYYRKFDVLMQEINQKLARENAKAEDYFTRFRYFQDVGNQKAALEDIDKAISLGKNNEVYFLERSELYYTRKEWEKAEKDMDAAISIKPEDISYYRRGIILFHAGKYNAAERDLLKTGSAQHLLAEIYLIQKKPKQACEQLVAIDEHDFDDDKEWQKYRKMFKDLKCNSYGFESVNMEEGAE